MKLCLAIFFAAAPAVFGWQAMPVDEDPLLHMPGTQPAHGVEVQSSKRCLTCHGGYEESARAGSHWKGSMMAQAGRDPIFWASLVVALQDSIWVTDALTPDVHGDGRPNACCLRPQRSPAHRTAGRRGLPAPGAAGLRAL